MIGEWTCQALVWTCCEGPNPKDHVTIAKNYLNAEEIDELNRIVVMWLDFAEDQARRRKQVFMKDTFKTLEDAAKNLPARGRNDDEKK